MSQRRMQSLMRLLKNCHRLRRQAVTTFQEGWITVDHMLYSSSPGLQLTGRVELPRAGDMQEAGRIPSSNSPSDHLPLLAKFKLS